MRKVIITEFHIERSKLEDMRAEFHPLALAINEHLKPGYYTEVDETRILIRDVDGELRYVMIRPVPGELYVTSVSDYEFNIPEELLIPEIEAGFYRIRGCRKTDAEIEQVYMDATFESIDDRNRFWRLVFGMRKTGIDDGLLAGIGKSFFDLGKGKDVFVNPDPPEGYTPPREVEKVSCPEIGEDQKFAD